MEQATEEFTFCLSVHATKVAVTDRTHLSTGTVVPLDLQDSNAIYHVITQELIGPV